MGMLHLWASTVLQVLQCKMGCGHQQRFVWYVMPGAECHAWVSWGTQRDGVCRLGETATLKSFHGASHMGILMDDRLIDEVIQIVKGRKSGPWTNLRSRVRKPWSFLQRLWGFGVYRGSSKVASWVL